MSTVFDTRHRGRSFEPFLGTCVFHPPRLNLFTNRQSLILFTSVFFSGIFCILMRLQVLILMNFQDYFAHELAEIVKL